MITLFKTSVFGYAGSLPINPCSKFPIAILTSRFFIGLLKINYYRQINSGANIKLNPDKNLPIKLNSKKRDHFTFPLNMSMSMTVRALYHIMAFFTPFYLLVLDLGIVHFLPIHTRSAEI
jgi:hypothetical protein